jgi:hypothetical protein
MKNIKENNYFSTLDEDELYEVNGGKDVTVGPIIDGNGNPGMV